VFIVSLCCFAHVIVGKLLLLIWKEIRQLCCFFLFCPKNACWESSARESYETVRLWKPLKPFASQGQSEYLLNFWAWTFSWG